MFKKNSFYLQLQSHIFFVLGKCIEYLNHFKPNNDHQSPCLMISAGKLGWKSVFFEELEVSAEEVIGKTRVVSISIDRNSSHFKQMQLAITSYTPTHMIYDPRSGPQGKINSIIDSIQLKFLISRFNVVPIIILTDASVRQHRNQAILLSGTKGVIVCFLSYKLTKKYFANVSCIGPSLIPLGSHRYRKNIPKFEPYNNDAIISFVGSNYPERQEFFNQLRTQLLVLKSKIAVNVREKSENIDNETYWTAIDESPLIVTTTFQSRDATPLKLDFDDLNQMVFRISEALARQKLLFCMHVPGMEEYLVAGVHYVEFYNGLDLATKLVFYSKHKELQKNIAISGHRRFIEFQESGLFWRKVQNIISKPLISDDFDRR